MGFGLTYTTFTYTPFNPPAAADLTGVRAALAAHQAHARATVADPADLANSLGLAPKELTSTLVDYYVNVRAGRGGRQARSDEPTSAPPSTPPPPPPPCQVTNTGTVASDDVVLGVLGPPGAGQDGGALQVGAAAAAAAAAASCDEHCPLPTHRRSSSASSACTCPRARR